MAKIKLKANRNKLKPVVEEKTEPVPDVIVNPQLRIILPEEIGSWKLLPSVPLSAACYSNKYTDLRRSKMILFGHCLLKYVEFAKMLYGKQTELVIELEKCCFENANVVALGEGIAPIGELFDDIYGLVCYRISSNLDPTHSIYETNVAVKKKIGQRLLDGEITVNQFVNMTSSEMLPEKYEEMKARIEISKTVTETKKSSSLYRCRICKENKCSMENLYNRSFDEGTNLRITCLNCGFQWNG
jgi:DNA-directed RNA polymerase subunit M/transcription elongation factor TFIIS